MKQEGNHEDPVLIVKVTIALLAMIGIAIAASGCETDKSLHVLLGCVNIITIAMMCWESGFLTRGYLRFGILAFGILTGVGLALDDIDHVRRLHLVSIGLLGMTLVYSIRFYQKDTKVLLDILKLTFPLSLAVSFVMLDFCLLYRHYLVILPDIAATALFAVYLIQTIRKDRQAVTH